MRYRLSAWILLSVFLFNSIGYGILFRLEQVILHEKAEELAALSIPRSSLHVITVTPQQAEKLDWQRSGKELNDGGRLYDVVRVEKANGLIRFYCAGDDMETKLVNTSQSAGGHSSLPYDNISAQLLKLVLSSSFVLPDSLPFTTGNSTSASLPAFTAFYSFTFCNEDFPPPRAAAV